MTDISLSVASTIITDPNELGAISNKIYKTNETHRKNALAAYHKTAEKRKRQILLTQLNSGKTKRPNQSSILKYELKYDVEKKMWF